MRTALCAKAALECLDDVTAAIFAAAKSMSRAARSDVAPG